MWHKFSLIDPGCILCEIHAAHNVIVKSSWTMHVWITQVLCMLFSEAAAWVSLRNAIINAPGVSAWAWQQLVANQPPDQHAELLGPMCNEEGVVLLGAAACTKFLLVAMARAMQASTILVAGRNSLSREQRAFSNCCDSSVPGVPLSPSKWQRSTTKLSA